MIQQSLYLGLASVALCFFTTVILARTNKFKAHKLLAWITFIALVLFVAAADTVSHSIPGHTTIYDGLFITHLTNAFVTLVLMLRSLVFLTGYRRPLQHRIIGYVIMTTFINTALTGIFLIARLPL